MQSLSQVKASDYMKGKRTLIPKQGCCVTYISKNRMQQCHKLIFYPQNNMENISNQHVSIKAGDRRVYHFSFPSPFNNSQ